jgi:CheY-like chemotaxis protein
VCPGLLSKRQPPLLRFLALPLFTEKQVESGPNVSSNSVPRVFVVADEHVIASSVAAILKLQGYSATSFNSPRGALAAIRSGALDLLISDFMTRGMPGVDLAEQIQARCPGCKVLHFSGQAIGSPGNQAAACSEYQLLKQEYEAALRKEALYDCGVAAWVQQAIQYKSKVQAVSAATRECLMAHSKGCRVCEV